VHFEVGAADDAPLVTFYGEVFGSGLQGFAGGGYDLEATLDRAHPDGLLVGLVQAPAEPGGRDELAPSAGSGEAVDWFEIVGSDPARSQQFNADLFGWTVDSSGFAGYAVVDTRSGRGIQGGIGGGVDARWATIYAGVADLDQTLSRVEKLGGSRISAPG
jgi:predicted enzyme related to lactoylglutathione lyase